MAGQSIDIPAGGYMFLDNDLTNDGTITMDTSASGYSYLYLEGYTLTNAGTFSVPADGNTRVHAYVDNSGSFVNTGTVEVDGATLYFYGGADVHEQPPAARWSTTEPSPTAPTSKTGERTRAPRCHRRPWC